MKTLILALLLIGCGGDGFGSGAPIATGGTSAVDLSTGGMTATSSSTGGASTVTTGGAMATTGGNMATGGSAATGGEMSTGGEATGGVYTITTTLKPNEQRSTAFSCPCYPGTLSANYSAYVVKPGASDWTWFCLESCLTCWTLALSRTGPADTLTFSYECEMQP